MFLYGTDSPPATAAGPVKQEEAAGEAKPKVEETCSLCIPLSISLTRLLWSSPDALIAAPASTSTATPAALPAGVSAAMAA